MKNSISKSEVLVHRRTRMDCPLQVGRDSSSSGLVGLIIPSVVVEGTDPDGPPTFQPPYGWELWVDKKNEMIQMVPPLGGWAQFKKGSE